jgi:1,4-alpha-glucan branching enzyme
MTTKESGNAAFISDVDVHLFSEGTHYRIYEKLGAHELERDGVKGTHFAVWAPNAARVSVVGDFNEWNADKNPMVLNHSSGIWSSFIPALGHGTLYKYFIDGANGHVQKTDPVGFASEMRPRTASIVWDLDTYKWNDAKWLENRDKKNSLAKPVSIYELHLGSWMRVQKMRIAG